MLDLVITLVFSIVMLFFMIFPAIKITEWIDKHYRLPQKLYTPIMLMIVVILSLMVGLFLKYT
ncbi:hypothetical protein MNB_SM-7-459 [hydrothermal vent metagenome]|uniref:Uncharacterized protein n=1 Tax=hydrothermal vent metagenome TaxID=652676 RepID=A0A1W1BTU0_9ZZZZ